MERTALITGATGGLGAAVTRRFLDDGWRVVATSREGRAPEGTQGRAGLEPAQADLLEADAAAAVVERAAAEPAKAPLRAVLNLVGGYFAGPRVHETAPADFERQLALNLRPTFLVTRAALPHLIDAGGGSIVCVGTRAARDPFPGASAYATSKAAVIAFARAVAAEYRDERVRCNVVAPSVIDTPANRRSMPKADHARWVSPDELAATIAFLCSDGAAATSGAVIPAYGRA